MPKELRSFIRETASWPDSSTYTNFVGVCAERQQMELLYVDLRPSAALGAYTHKVCIIRDNIPYDTLLPAGAKIGVPSQLSDYSINCNKFARRSLAWWLKTGCVSLLLGRKLSATTYSSAASSLQQSVACVHLRSGGRMALVQSK